MNKVVRFLVLISFSLILISCNNSRRSLLSTSASEEFKGSFYTDISADKRLAEANLTEEEKECEKLHLGEDCLNVFNTFRSYLQTMLDADGNIICERIDTSSFIQELNRLCCETVYEEQINTIIGEACPEEEENCPEGYVQNEECLSIMNEGLFEIARLYEGNINCDILESSELLALFQELEDNCCSPVYEEMITENINENCDDDEEQEELCGPGDCNPECEAPKTCEISENRKCECVCPDINQMTEEEKYNLLDQCKHDAGNIEFTEELCNNYQNIEELAMELFIDKCCPDTLEHYITLIKQGCLDL
jgi:hypothetical protein